MLKNYVTAQFRDTDEKCRFVRTNNSQPSYGSEGM
jgi:hypothetical protein